MTTPIGYGMSCDTLSLKRSNIFRMVGETMTDRIISGTRTVSRKILNERASRAATGLNDLGVKTGGTVAWMLRNDFPCLEVSLAAARLGAYAVPVNWHGKVREVEYILRDSGAKAFVVHADLLGGIRGGIPKGVTVLAVETPPEIREAHGLSPASCQVPDGVPEWGAWADRFGAWSIPLPPSRPTMLYTSGTTGHPKGVRRPPFSQEQQARAAAMLSRIYGTRPGMRTVMAAPLYHSAPYSYCLSALESATILLLQPRFDPEVLLESIQTHRITHLYMVPTMFVRLLALPKEIRSRYDHSSLEWVVHAGAPCPPDIKRAMIDWWGPVIHEAYAGTETGWITTCSSAEWLARPGTAGKPIAGATLAILDDDGQPLPPGEPGEVYMRQEALPDFTYHNDDEARRSIESDGLVTLGDVGYLDEEGYLFLCDRKKDMVISGGVNIYPAEIEAVLITMPGVADCAVFGVPDREFGESLAAAVVAHPEAALTPESVKTFIRRRLSGFKTPRLVEFPPTLPRDDTGKINKRLLRAPHWKDAGRAI